MKRTPIALLISILVCVSGYCQTTSPCTFYESDLPKVWNFEYGNIIKTVSLIKN